MIDFGQVRQNCPLLQAASGHPSLWACCRTALSFLMLGFLGPWPDAHANSIARREKGPTRAHTHMTILPIVGISDVEYRFFVMPLVTVNGITLREDTKTTYKGEDVLKNKPRP